MMEPGWEWSIIASVFSLHFTQGEPAAAAPKSLQSCPTLYDLIDSSPPGSAVSGILQARTVEWVAISFSNAWKWLVKVKSLSRVWFPIIRDWMGKKKKRALLSRHHLDYANCSWDRTRKSKVLPSSFYIKTFVILSHGSQMLCSIFVHFLFFFQVG